MATNHHTPAHGHNITKRIVDAQVTAHRLIDASNACSKEQGVLRARLVDAAATIEILCELLTKQTEMLNIIRTHQHRK